ncbi:MAG: hypothetical protein ACFFCP_19455 [Promethearchaeota archaeon]
MVILLVFMMLTVAPMQSVAEETPCIIMAKVGEWYNIALNGISDNSEAVIALTFDPNQPVVDRLEVRGSMQIENDLFTNSIYYVKNGSTVLCTVHYKGLDNILLGEERARLEITSETYLVHLAGVQVEEASIEFEIPPSFQIVLALCSLVPFFLLMPDAINELQLQLDADTMPMGVYGRILSLLLPLLSIALTILLLGGLNVF